MAQESSIRNLSEADRFVIFECVFEYISDIPTLLSLSVVSKQTRRAVYRSNGLREIFFESGDLRKLNGSNIRGENAEETLKHGLLWIWNVGKRLKSVRLLDCTSGCFFCSSIHLLNSLAANEKRRIETIEIHSDTCEIASVLVRENRNTLRRLCVELRDQSSVASLCLHDNTSCSFSEFLSSQSQIFWSAVQQCERLESLDLEYSKESYPIFPVDFYCFLRRFRLRHLGLNFRSKVSCPLLEVLSVENVRENLERLKFEVSFCKNFLQEVFGIEMEKSPFVNVTKLSFDFPRLCCDLDSVNWVRLLTIFPVVKQIKISLGFYPESYLSQSLWSFCKTYLEVSASRVCNIEIEIPVARYRCLQHRDRNTSSTPVKSATLRADQAWCISQGVLIETETRKDKVERVTLRKDPSALIFDFKFL